jgi:hypothetical protein
MSIENQNKSEKTGRSGIPGHLEGLQCVNFQNLKRWQVEMFNQAVEIHRRSLSMREGRYVELPAAEQDFFDQRFQAQAQEWRHQYCGTICPFSNSCLLAHRFKWARHEDGIRQTG